MFWGEIEESEKASSAWELSPGHLAWAASALSLSYNNQTTTSQNKISLLNYAECHLFSLILLMYTYKHDTKHTSKDHSSGDII